MRCAAPRRSMRSRCRSLGAGAAARDGIPWEARARGQEGPVEIPEQPFVCGGPAQKSNCSEPWLPLLGCSSHAEKIEDSSPFIKTEI